MKSEIVDVMDVPINETSARRRISIERKTL